MIVSRSTIKMNLEQALLDLTNISLPHPARAGRCVSSARCVHSAGGVSVNEHSPRHEGLSSIETQEPSPTIIIMTSHSDRPGFCYEEDILLFLWSGREVASIPTAYATDSNEGISSCNIHEAAIRLMSSQFNSLGLRGAKRYRHR